MSEVELDLAMLADFHSAGTDLRTLAKVCDEQGNHEKAERYRRISEMLDGVAYQIRDPLLAAAWKHTGIGSNLRVERARNLERLVFSELAVYLLVVNDGQKVKHACRLVAERTGENAETLRGRFKGLAIPDYQKSKQGRRTAVLFDSLLRWKWKGQPVKWQDAYEYIVSGAALADAEAKSGQPPH